MNDNEKRKAEMIRLRRRGWTLQLIGKRYGVSRQRVYQIIGSTGTISQQIERKEAGRLQTA